MAKQLDTTGLFLSQISNHTEELSGLLSTPTNTPINQAVVERCIVSTSMLASSASLMDLSYWNSFLKTFVELLTTCRDRRLPWGDQLSQVVSEIIEREELLITVAGKDRSKKLKDIVSPAEMEALLEELKECLQMAQTATPSPPPVAPEQPLVPSATVSAQHHPYQTDIDPLAALNVESESPQPAAQPQDAADVQAQPADALPPGTDQPLGNTVFELQSRTAALVSALAAANWDSESGAPTNIEQVRRELSLIDFYACTMDDILRDCISGSADIRIGTLQPVRTAIDDCVRILAAGTGRTVSVNFVGDADSIDAQVFFPVTSVLRRMIVDIFARCDDESLRIEISVEKRRGSLYWAIRDNGSNFLTDSRVDPDEYLAFYPGLIEGRKHIDILHGLLWVEPGENQRSRFAFTTSASVEGGPFVIWGEGDQRFAVRSSQISDVLDAGSGELQSDSKGDCINREGQRVPVVRLGHLYDEAPLEGNKIAIVGALEKRIAFYVGDEGTVENGLWMKNAISKWRDLKRGAVEVLGEKLPLLQPQKLFQRHLFIQDGTVDRDVSGGRSDDEHDLSQTQASMEKDPSPVETKLSTVAAPTVLIFEQSDDLREKLESILSGEFQTTTVEQLDEALEHLQEPPPSLIVSEFRAPSMGAKVLVETLQARGMEIPVLVTTSHHGAQARTLVSKLKVAGYISKPLVPGDVLDRVSSFLKGQAEAAKG